MSVRTRLAPSPTGDPHVGTAYSALFSRAFAIKNGGQFILRIEDTDQQRTRLNAESSIMDALQWLGLTWDEGPDVGGDYGPYRQSDRLDIYRQFIAELLEREGAFVCFCTKERLDEVRRGQMQRGETPKYDGHCLQLSADEVDRRIAEGEPHVIRLVVPQEGSCLLRDEIRGEIEIPWSQVDMQVLIKSDGFPTYHFASTLDDHLMDISHVIRGEEWISSWPKHFLIYQYFDWTMPKHIHLPLLRNPDRSKMSKRKNATSIDYFRRRGFLPEALVNYLATMGWSMPDEREKFSMEEFCDSFDVSRLSALGPVFDIEKLSWLNGLYMRDLPVDEFKTRVYDWGFGGSRADHLVSLVQERTETFDDLFRQADYLLGDRVELSAEAFDHKKLTNEDCKKVLDFANRCLDSVETWDRDAIYSELRNLADTMDIKFRDFLFPMFVAISGRSVTLPLFDSLVLLGRDVTTIRFRSAIQALGGISKKQVKRLDREWRDQVQSSE